MAESPINHDPFPTTPAEWLKSPLGSALLEQEERLVQETLEDVFGEECVQIGTWGQATQFLRLSRTQRSLLVAEPGNNASVIAEPHQLPIASDSVDSVILPHTLDYTERPHAVLREVHRILRSSGHLILLGFRPGGLWGFRRLVPGAEFPPGAHDLLSDRTLRDWMKLLDMRIHGVTRYFFRWPLLHGAGTKTNVWERRGRTYWPELSACFMIAAQKRVRTMTPVRPMWRKKAKVIGGLVESATRQRSVLTQTVEIWTDGACRGNPGPGGWGVVLSAGKHYREMHGGEHETTNNRMELKAAIEALNALKGRRQVILHTDSKYVMDGIRSWIDGWKARGWKTAAKKPVKNQDLWMALDEARDRHDVDWRWVKGHSGNDGNERADELANLGIDEL